MGLVDLLFPSIGTGLISCFLALGLVDLLFPSIGTGLISGTGRPLDFLVYAADAVYHRVCSANFHTMKEEQVVHDQEVDLEKRLPRSVTRERKNGCLPCGCQVFLEKDDEHITIKDFIQYVEIDLADSGHSAYSYLHI